MMDNIHKTNINGGGRQRNGQEEQLDKNRQGRNFRPQNRKPNSASSLSVSPVNVPTMILAPERPFDDLFE